MCQTEEQLY